MARGSGAWGAVVGAGTISAVAFVVAGPGVVQGVAFTVPFLVAPAVALTRWRQAEPGDRRLLATAATAVVLYCGVTLVWFLGPTQAGLAYPFPSVLDLGYFTAYSLFAVFLVMLLRRQAGDADTESRVAVTDAAILTAAMASVVWSAEVIPLLDSGATPLVAATALAYPCFTLVLAALAARLALHLTARADVAGALLLTWVAIEVAADVAYGFQSARGSFSLTAPLTAAWMVSTTALAGFLAHPRAHALVAGCPADGTDLAEPRVDETGSAGAGQADAPRARRLRSALLFGAVVVTTALAWGTPGNSRVLLGIALVSVVLVLYRTAVLGGDLARERELRVRLEQAAAELERQRDRIGRQAEQMQELAVTDVVTGLGNRMLLFDRAALVPAASLENSLLLLDLDGFKEINDSLGHPAGDALLLEVGSRLGQCVREKDTVVRLGGDEFALWLPGVGSAAAMTTAERVLDELRKPFSLAGTVISIRGSIGVACSATADNVDEMLRNADLAMYDAKGAGRDRARAFDPRMHEDAERRLTIGTELVRALDQREFVVYYQPIIDARSGEVTSMEALVRWDHPTRGVLPPSEFLPAAERTGLIVELGRQTLEQACEQMTQWRLDWPDLIVAVNVSHLELLHADFVMTVHEVLERTGLEPTALRLEVTETVLADEATIATAIAPLVAAGIGFALDDFGTGHSSLSRLRHLQVGHLKIDKSFIDEIESDRGASAPLLSSIIALAHSIGQVVVAEGVETEQQAAFLADQSCDELQGYLISRPVAAEQVLPVLIATGTRARPPENGPDGWTALIEELVDPEVELDAVMPEVLARLSEVADLPCCFLTEVADGVQRTTHCHNVRPGSVRISTGLVVPWSGTLCHRLLEDGLVSVRSARDELADVPAARDLGIGLYLTVPIRDPQRRLVGTLCAASDEAATASVHQVQLMRVVADAVERRLGRPLSVA